MARKLAALYSIAVLDLGARRILIYGVTGSGKTTLARHLSVATGIPWFEADQYTWHPGWVQVPLELQRERIAEICSRDAWILDTAYGAWLDIPLARVELIIALDYPRWVSLARLLRRTLSRIITRDPVCNGNVESLKATLSRQSIMAWHFRSFQRKRERILSWKSSEGGVRTIHIRSRSDLDGLFSFEEPLKSE